MAWRTGTGRAKGVFPRWVWWIFTAFPALFVLVGIGLLAEAIKYTSQADSTRGKVVDVSAQYDSEGSVSYLPTIRYRRDDGRFVEAETNRSSRSYDFEIGQRVEILYTYDDPPEVRINSFFDLYGSGLIVIVVGGLFIRLIGWFRRKVSGGSAMLGLVAVALAERMEEAAREQGQGAEPDREPEPRTTDVSRRGHVHKPTPKREPVVRRMR